MSGCVEGPGTRRHPRTRVPGRLARAGWLAASALLLLGWRPADAQGFTEWLNARMDEAVAARLGQRSSGRQVEAPAVSRGSTTLLDSPSFSDLAGVALNLAPLGGGTAGGGDPRANAVTLTPYAVLTALLGLDPDSPFTLERHRGWRTAALTLGTEESGDQGPAATLLGLKYEVLDRQRVDPSSEQVAGLRTQLGLAGDAFGDLAVALQDSLHAWVAADMDEVAFINEAEKPEQLSRFLTLAGPEREAVLLAMIADRVDPFLRVRKAADEVLAEVRSAPLLSAQVQARLVDAGRDEVRLGLVFQTGLQQRVVWTLDGGATILGADGTVGRTWGGSVASGLTVGLSGAHMAGPDPVTLDLAFESTFADAAVPLWRLQGKVTLPLMVGISLPVSATWASRSDLVEEEGLMGRFGFTVDTSRLLAALGG